MEAVQKDVAESPIFPASSTIGGAVAGKTRDSAVFALTASWLCIIIYLWVRFQGVAFGLAAVIALIHDVFVMLGAVAISIYIAPYFGFLMVEPFKINLPIVAAFLTIIGYSVNDTIVVFDRIREVRGKDPNITREMVNNSTNQTLSRTLLTSFTVLLVVVVLYFWGGDAIHGFAFALGRGRDYGHVQFGLRGRSHPAVAGRQARESFGLDRAANLRRSQSPLAAPWGTNRNALVCGWTSSRAFFVKGSNGFFGGPSAVDSRATTMLRQRARGVKRVRRRGFLALTAQDIRAHHFGRR